ncbi:MAG TPA: HEAT repeat domain-containing protein, partial [Clostridiales bacterium]|nr:HEAT repeat domain-containing protein [Clostridiales bacterium]
MFGPSLKKIEKWAQKGKIAKLEKVINGNNAEFREAAFKALAKSGDHDAVTHLT